MRRSAAQAPEDAGFSVSEMLIATSLLAALGLSWAGFMSSQTGTARAMEDQRQSMNVARVAMDHLTRDLRQARSVRAGSTATELRLWDDRDGDGSSTAAEEIVWSLVAQADGSLHLLRSAGGPAGNPVAARLTATSGFDYHGTPDKAKLVSITLDIDTDPGVGSKVTRTQSSVRLRNA